LKLACSNDGREESIPINQDASVYIGRFEEGQRLTHPLAKNRHAWVQLISGDLAVNTTVLSPGDGAALSEEGTIALLSVAGAHFVVFDLN
jgi:redox-sensitive bicupin YhaK (pirin superfamily)